MLSPHDRMIHLFDTALRRYVTVIDQVFPDRTSLAINDRDEFIAQAQPDSDGVLVTVSTGVVDETAALWDRALALSSTLPTEHRLNITPNETDAAIGASAAQLWAHCCCAA